MVAPLGTALPTTVVTAPAAAFKDLGYIDESGFVISQATDWVKINDWGGDQIRTFLTKFTGTVKFTCLETNTEVLKMVYGSSNVTTTAPTVSTGTLQAIKLNAVENPSVELVVNILDGLRKMRVVCPNVQITERGDVSFSKTDPVKWELTGECYPDATGNSLYIYTDDGTFSP
jgi:hypothetical protein